MQLSETVKLYMTKDQKPMVTETMQEYIDTVNGLVSLSVSGVSITKYTTADVSAKLPSALTNQCIRDAKSVVRKYTRACRDADRKNALLEKQGRGFRVTVTLPVLRKPCCYINNQNYRIKDGCIEFPVFVNGRVKRISVMTRMTDRQKALLSGCRLGTMRIVRKGRKIVAQIVYEAMEPLRSGDGNVMGVDLGIKCPAVSYISDCSVKFYGNGRKNKYIRRHYRYLRGKLQKTGHMDAVRRIHNKEQRIMKDTDHKISREIVNTAVLHNVKVIKLERLANIRSATRKSRKNNHSLHNWSFYRLAQYIEYKARLAGISVEYVDPAYTSQRCPVCGHVHHASDRNYTCRCGFHTHRDLLGAMNICRSTEYVGNRHTAQEAICHVL